MEHLDYALNFKGNIHQCSMRFLKLIYLVLIIFLILILFYTSTGLSISNLQL